jgi:1,4-alpha-glucan branching enzyme
MATKTRLIKIKFKPPVNAGDVKIAGDFTDWQHGAITMSKSSRSAEWTASLRLTPGDHQYRFIMDGNWYTDPSTEHVHNDLGSDNSILRVS